MNIDKMSADRELDKFIAEHILQEEVIGMQIPDGVGTARHLSWIPIPYYSAEMKGDCDMNMVRIAIELIRYYNVTRQAGHTTAMLSGAKNTKGVIIVAHTMNHATDLAKQCPSATPVGLDGTGNKLKGRRKPLLLDNSAVIWVLDGLLKEIFSLRKTVRELEEKAEAFRHV